MTLVYSLEEYLPLPIRSWVHGKLRELRTLLEQNGIVAQREESDSVESKPVKEAKNRLQSSRDTLHSQRTEKEEKEKDLTADYGKDEVFRTMKDKCVSLDSGEYTYELCWLGQVTQRSKKGGSHSMGHFEGFGSVVVDEDVPVNGKGLGSGERVALKYENGAHCWNGPNRSTTVVLACAAEEEVWKVTEEEKCVYRMEAGNPSSL